MVRGEVFGGTMAVDMGLLTILGVLSALVVIVIGFVLSRAQTGAPDAVAAAGRCGGVRWLLCLGAGFGVCFWLPLRWPGSVAVCLQCPMRRDRHVRRGQGPARRYPMALPVDIP